MVAGVLVGGAVLRAWGRRDGLGTGWRLLLAVSLAYLAFDLPDPRLLLLGLTVAVTVVGVDMWWTISGGLEPDAGWNVEKDPTYFCPQCSRGFAEYEEWHLHRWLQHVATPGAGGVLRLAGANPEGEAGHTRTSAPLRAAQGQRGAIDRAPARQGGPGGAEILLVGSSVTIVAAAVVAAVVTSSRFGP
jgi:hypothetical protein